MTTPWKTVLQALPADGETVWVRRLRWFDTPALATWDATAGEFVTPPADNLTINGGTFDGSYMATLHPNWLGSGHDAWGILVAGIWLVTLENPVGTWTIQQTDAIANAYYGNPYASPPFPKTETVVNVAGAPTWSGYTSFSIVAPTPSVVIPAWGVHSWRPQ